VNNLTEQQLTTVWLGAFRYHLGRQTYAVSGFCEILQAQWESIPKCCQDLIKRDLEEEFNRDDECRASGGQYKPLGDNCDRIQGEKVRKLWGGVQ
jgi:hypothetical protein